MHTYVIKELLDGTGPLCPYNFVAFFRKKGTGISWESQKGSAEQVLNFVWRELSDALYSVICERFGSKKINQSLYGLWRKDPLRYIEQWVKSPLLNGANRWKITEELSFDIVIFNWLGKPIHPLMLAQMNEWDGLEPYYSRVLKGWSGFGPVPGVSNRWRKSKRHRKPKFFQKLRQANDVINHMQEECLTPNRRDSNESNVYWGKWSDDFSLVHREKNWKKFRSHQYKNPEPSAKLLSQMNQGNYL